MKFKPDKRGTEKLFANIGANVQAAIAGVAKNYQGRPVEEVNAALETALRRAGVTPGDVTEYAEAISKGEPLPPITIK